MAGEWKAGSIVLFGRIEIFLRIQHARQRAQSQIELVDGGGASASRTAFGAWPGVTAKVVEGVKRDVPPRGGGDEGLRTPMRRQRQPQMIGFRVGLDLEAGKAFGRHLLAPLRVDSLQA